MAKRNSEKNFIELGNFFREWREEKFKSALAFFKENSEAFSFGYNSYAGFENGTSLPSVKQLLEICNFFQQNPSDPLLTWARVQMLTKEHKQLFHSRKKTQKRQTQELKTKSFENTWTLSPGELKILLQNPWLTDLICCLYASYPEEVQFTELELDGLEPKEFCQKYISLWIESGNIVQSEQGIRVTNPYIVIPHNNLGKEVRAESLRRITEKIIENENSFHCMTTRNLSSGQMKRWCKKLEDLEKEFEAEHKEEVTDSKYSDMRVLMLGLTDRNPNKLKK